MFDPTQIPHVWRAHSLAQSTHALSSGFTALDAALGGGWPSPALIELFTDVYGIGELRLVLPLLRQQAGDSGRPLLVWLNPPFVPNAVALAQYQLDARHWCARELSPRDSLWSCEQALRSSAVAVVLLWLNGAPIGSLRRLKLACVATRTIAILYRPTHEAQQPSPAHVRIALHAQRDALHVHVLKAQGQKPSKIELPLALDIRS